LHRSNKAANDQPDKEHNKEDLCDIGGRAGEAQEAEERRDQSQNQERQSPVKHDLLLLSGFEDIYLDR
jgi:F0F1-type ATP synthase assembly protein I